MGQSAATKGFLFLVFFQLIIGLQSVELNKCQQFVTDKHIKYLDDMIDSQMESSCTVEVKLLRREHLSDYCYIRGSVYLLGDLLRKNMAFKLNSLSFNRTHELTQLYNNGITECVLKNNDSYMRKPLVCFETMHLTLAGLLEKVKELFKEAKDFRERYSDHHNCPELYEECEEEEEVYSPKGLSQCDCSSPSEKSVSQRSPHPLSLGLPTLNSAEDMSVRMPAYYPYRPTAPLGTDQNTDTATLISTDTTIFQSSGNTDLPQNVLHVTLESPKSPTLPPFKSMQPKGTKTSNVQVTTGPLETSYANTEQLFTNTKSQNTLPEFNKDAYGASSSLSTASKMRRSVETSEDTFETFTSSGYSGSIADLSDDAEGGDVSQSHTPVLHRKETKDNDLGWAAATPSSGSSMSLSMSARTGQLIKSLGTEITLHSKTIVNEGVSTHHNIPQSENNLAALTSQNRDNLIVNPRSDFNQLPVIATEQKNDEKTEHGQWLYLLFLIFIVGSLIFGLLCFYRKYRRRRQLNRNKHDPETPEARALQSDLMELNDL